ncbi:MAG TPA: hypothetical protein DDW87_05105, partial [Firmicutes bacterium]|nr:hypothetical protein [Bacillota bacterium]
NTDLLVRCNHTIERGDPCTFSLTWPKGAKELVLKDVSEFAMGYTFLTCQIKLGPVSIKRDYGFQIAQAKEQSAKAATLKERKRMALEFISKWGEPNIHRALAILATDGDAKGAEKLVLRAIREINHRFDCSDFELIMVFKLWKTYREKGVFPEKVWDKLEEAILGFRYWFDEPGNDVMWFFSENHALLFHTCQLLAGQLFPDRIFSNAGITGSEHQQKARRRLDDWFARFFSEGYAEWNSSAYLPINVMGLLQILEYVDDAPLKDKAKQALDLTFRYIAIHSLDGYLACSHGRIYEKELKGNYGNQTTNMAWIAWGLANINHTTYANVALSLSDYVPPQDYVEYAALRPGQRLEYMFHQGPVEYADLYAHKTADYLLTSAIEFAPRPKGYQEHVLHASFGAEA